MHLKKSRKNICPSFLRLEWRSLMFAFQKLTCKCQRRKTAAPETSQQKVGKRLRLLEIKPMTSFLCGVNPSKVNHFSFTNEQCVLCFSLRTIRSQTYLYLKSKILFVSLHVKSNFENTSTYILNR